MGNTESIDVIKDGFMRVTKQEFEELKGKINRLDTIINDIVNSRDSNKDPLTSNKVKVKVDGKDNGDNNEIDVSIQEIKKEIKTINNRMREIENDNDVDKRNENNKIVELEEVIRLKDESIRLMRKETSDANDGKTLVSKKIALLEKTCKLLYLNIDTGISKKLDIDESIRYVFESTHKTIKTYKDGEGTSCTYIGDTVGDIPHGRGKILYNTGDVYEGTYMNGLRHGSIKITWSGTDKGARVSSDYQYVYDRLHGLQKMQYIDGHTAYSTYDGGVISYIEKQVYRDHTVYINHNQSQNDYYQLKYYHTDDISYVFKNKDDDTCVAYKLA